MKKCPMCDEDFNNENSLYCDDCSEHSKDYFKEWKQKRMLLMESYDRKTKTRDKAIGIFNGFVVVSIIITVIAGFASFEYTEFCGPIFLIGLLVSFCGYHIVKDLDTQEGEDYKAFIANIRKEKQEKINKFRETLKIKYGELLKQANIPENCMQVSVNNNIEDYNYIGKYFIWKEKDILNLFPNIDLNIEANISSENICDSIHKTIPLSNIEYYNTKGEIFRETKISGGGGGGSNIGGAIVGGIIAGDAGAIIGSREKVKEIKSELITHDTRKTFINYYDDENTIKSILMAFEDFQVLQKIIPEKDYNILHAIKTNQVLKEAVKSNGTDYIVEQIKKLSILKNEGILSENEFEEKKKEILARM